MDAIDEAFATGIVDQKELCAPLCYALSVGKKTLNKYYSLSDHSHIYRIAMSMFSYFWTHCLADICLVLHPSLKLTYFQRLSWEKEWVNAAIAVTKNAWDRFKPLTPPPAPASQTEIASVSQIFSFFFACYRWDLLRKCRPPNQITRSFLLCSLKPVQACQVVRWMNLSAILPTAVFRLQIL